MFKLVKNLSTWWPVTVLEPDNDNPGTLVEKTFQAQFVVRSREETKALQEKRNALVRQLPTSSDYLNDEAAAMKKAEDIGALIEAHDREVFHLNITNWKDIEDENEQPIPFSVDALDMALNVDRVRIGFATAFGEIVSNDKARLGNSKA